MTDRRTIEDVLPRSWTVRGVTVRYPSPEERVKQLHAATADGPVFSADGSLAVHRTDPELAKRLLKRCSRMYPPPPCDDPKCPVCSAAALLAAPAPTTEEADDE